MNLTEKQKYTKIKEAKQEPAPKCVKLKTRKYVDNLKNQVQSTRLYNQDQNRNYEDIIPHQRLTVKRGIFPYSIQTNVLSKRNLKHKDEKKRKGVILDAIPVISRRKSTNDYHALGKDTENDHSVEDSAFSRFSPQSFGQKLYSPTSIVDTLSASSSNCTRIMDINTNSEDIADYAIRNEGVEHNMLNDLDINLMEEYRYEELGQSINIAVIKQLRCFGSEPSESAEDIKKKLKELHLTRQNEYTPSSRTFGDSGIIQSSFKSAMLNINKELRDDYKTCLPQQSKVNNTTKKSSRNYLVRSPDKNHKIKPFQTDFGETYKPEKRKHTQHQVNKGVEFEQSFSVNTHPKSYLKDIVTENKYSLRFNTDSSCTSELSDNEQNVKDKPFSQKDTKTRKNTRVQKTRERNVYAKKTKEITKKSKSHQVPDNYRSNTNKVNVLLSPDDLHGSSQFSSRANTLSPVFFSQNSTLKRKNESFKLDSVLVPNNANSEMFNALKYLEKNARKDTEVRGGINFINQVW